jgi:nucleotide-binding universal stress UspA family protein
VGYVPAPIDEQTLREIVEQRDEAARALVDDRLALCEGVDAEGAVVVGNPAGELILATEDLDLLVLGSRRWGPVKRLALGTTSEHVIRHTACPVLVPPRGASSELDRQTPSLDEVAVP